MSPCGSCAAKCCTYLALQIDTPHGKNDFENIRWFLAHERVHVYIEKRKWFLEFQSDCRYLSPTHQCTIYEKRPAICRSHSVHECEFWSDEFDHDVVFASLEEFDRYLAQRFPRRVRKKLRQRASSLKK